MITLYCIANPPAFVKPDRVRDLRGLWAAEECELPYQIHWLDMSKGAQSEPAYTAINPFGVVPAMTDGAFALFESGAVITYLCEKADWNIPPAGTQARALYNQWCFAALSTVEPYVFQYLIAAGFHKDAAWSKERAPWLRERAVTRLSAFDQALKGRMFLLGEEFSGADILMGHVLNFVADPSLLDGLRNVTAYDARLKARPAYVRALSAQARGRNASIAAQ